MPIAQFMLKKIASVGPAFEDCFVRAEQVLKKASQAWSQGNPEDPNAAEVLKEILLIFENDYYGFLRIPSNRLMVNR